MKVLVLQAEFGSRGSIAGHGKVGSLSPRPLLWSVDQSISDNVRQFHVASERTRV